MINNHQKVSDTLKQELSTKGFAIPTSEEFILKLMVERLIKLRDLNRERLGKKSIDKMFKPYVFDIDSDEFDEHSIIVYSDQVCFRFVIFGDELPSSKMIGYPKAKLIENFSTKEFPNLIEASRIFTRKDGKEYNMSLLKVVEACFIVSRLFRCNILGSSRDKHVEYYNKFVETVILGDKYGDINGNCYVVLSHRVTRLFKKLFGKENYDRLEAALKAGTEEPLLGYNNYSAMRQN